MMVICVIMVNNGDSWLPDGTTIRGVISSVAGKSPDLNGNIMAMGSFHLVMFSYRRGNFIAHHAQKPVYTLILAYSHNSGFIR